MNNYSNIIFEIRDDYYFVKINRPKNLNALNQDTISELKQCFDFIKKNSKGFFGVILTGEGDKSFVAGADIKEFANFSKKEGEDLARNGQESLFNLIENFLQTFVIFAVPIILRSILFSILLS